MAQSSSTLKSTTLAGELVCFSRLELLAWGFIPKHFYLMIKLKKQQQAKLGSSYKPMEVLIFGGLGGKSNARLLSDLTLPVILY